MRRTLVTVAVTASVAATTLAGTAAGASATTRASAPATRTRAAAIDYDVTTTPKGAKCYAAVDAKPPTGSKGWYVRARFYSKGTACTGWLERRKSGTKKRNRISGYHYTGGNPSGAGNWSSTGWYKDTGYQSRACSYADQGYGWF